ncbi:MAG TPA: phosphatase PAP2 family protein, partial [Longimicrobium sp.]|nr:phosphatase PAP2 family protein [Longimicrobium sp.]
AAYEWEDGMGSPTPPGHWNVLASMLITETGLSDLESARVLAVMNIAMFDASIACWETKFHYWSQRPSQANPRIRMSVPLPNFPSYPSGHAAFSGAASEILAARFPERAPALRTWAADAAWSRILGGIHYRFDGEAGLVQGRSVAHWVLQRIGEGGPLLPQVR